MDVAKVVRTVDDPELFVAGGEIEDLLILRQYDERRKAELGANGNNVFLRILHDTCCGIGRSVRGRSVERGCAKNNNGEGAKQQPGRLNATPTFHRRAPLALSCCWSEPW